MLAPEQPPGVDEPLEVLSWLERPDPEDVRPVERRLLAGGHELGADAGVRDDEPLRLDPERLSRIVGRVARVREDDVAGATASASLRRCMAIVRGVHHSG